MSDQPTDADITKAFRILDRVGYKRQQGTRDEEDIAERDWAVDILKAAGRPEDFLDDEPPDEPPDTDDTSAPTESAPVMGEHGSEPPPRGALKFSTDELLSAELSPPCIVQDYL